MKKILSLKQAVGLFLFLALFILAAYSSRAYQAELTVLIDSYGLLSQVFYASIAMLATVFAPLNMTFLIPVASTAFGPFTAALLSIIGWTVGSIIAFYIARKYGRRLIGRFANLQKIDELESVVPERNIFIWVILIRMAVPADILSYALGLFVPMSYWHYSIATLIGVTPFAFIFSYASTLAVPFMVGAIVLALIASTLGFWWIIRKSKHANSVTNKRV